MRCVMSSPVWYVVVCYLINRVWYGSIYPLPRDGKGCANHVITITIFTHFGRTDHLQYHRQIIYRSSMSFRTCTFIICMICMICMIIIILLLRGGHIKQDLRYTQKPMYFSIFTNNSWSYLLWSPVRLIWIVILPSDDVQQRELQRWSLLRTYFPKKKPRYHVIIENPHILIVVWSTLWTADYIKMYQVQYVSITSLYQVRITTAVLLRSM